MASLGRAAGLLIASVMAMAACGLPEDRASVDAPFRVEGVKVPPETLNAYVARHAGFTSRGGQMECAYEALGQQARRVFIWALCLELVPSGDTLASGSGLSGPIALELAPSPSRVWTVQRLEQPGDGDRFAPDIRRIFPWRARWAIARGQGRHTGRSQTLSDSLHARAWRRERGRQGNIPSGPTKVPPN